MAKLMQYAPLAARLLLGAVFTVFGLNGFFQFLPMPPMEGPPMEFMGALGAAGYFFPLLKATEVTVGLALLSGFFVPLALTVLAPITINIFAFHAFLAPSGLPMAIAIVVLQIFLAWSKRDAYRAVLSAK